MELKMKITKERWEQAQKFEKDHWSCCPKNADDWNDWWSARFNNYEFLKGKGYNSLFECGCGPYARNTKIILNNIDSTIDKISLLDPLLDNYVVAGYSVADLIKSTGAKAYNIPLEQYNNDNIQYDIVVCINVLDHVYDTSECFKVIDELLAPEGTLIFGQDLTNEDDMRQCPETVTDIGHPIKIYHKAIRKYLESYNHIQQDILPREAGRNPQAHYGTLIYAGVK